MPEPTLQTTALRYAAGDLNPNESAAFEAQLADDQDARDALSEAVRLSAAAIGQKPPTPNPSFRAILRARLNWDHSRGHPLAWAATGAAVVAACTFIGLALADSTEPVAGAPANVAPVPPTEEAPNPRSAEGAESAAAPEQHEQSAQGIMEHLASSPCVGTDASRSVAEIWADLSTHDQVEKVRDDEQRWRQKMHNLSHPHHVSAASRADSP
ncbi:hypothetical protein J8F10_25110 [Gemmata sp. G18]|uniref:Anti sigma-E protein RseA N-terminal domain-containing protein n=1 Tax=Gemmata palustris TaxID=2822762 RepID=A0ABS5BYQ1_9BACT|nr:hypothetical protein [Gemmata palustris]MBP3958542.1 hypothetical protein [Gemmata palustris]